MEKIKNLFHFIVYKDFKVKSDFIKAILSTGITTVLLNGVIDRSRTVAVVVRRVEDVDGGGGGGSRRSGQRTRCRGRCHGLLNAGSPSVLSDFSRQRLLGASLDLCQK